MTSKSFSLVNRKVAAARLLLVQADGFASTAPDTHLRRLALYEAALFQLVCAYRHYLYELAEYYRLKPVGDYQQAGELVAALEPLGRFAAEADELQKLRDGYNSWLYHLSSAYQSLWDAPLPTVAKKSFGSDALEDEQRIALTNISVDPTSLSSENLSRWLQEFEQLITRQRLTLIES